MNPKTTLVIAFSETMPEIQREEVLTDILRVEGVDTVCTPGEESLEDIFSFESAAMGITPGHVAIVEMNELCSGSRVEREISELPGVEFVAAPPLSDFYANELNHH